MALRMWAFFTVSDLENNPDWKKKSDLQLSNWNIVESWSKMVFIYVILHTIIINIIYSGY